MACKADDHNNNNNNLHPARIEISDYFAICTPRVLVYALALK